MLATLVQLMGEDKAFDYLKALHKNVNQYTKSGAAPRARGSHRREPGRHHVPARRRRPGDRRGAGEDRVAVRGHRLRDRQHEHRQGREEHGERQKWYDWALGAEAQSIGAQAKVSYQVPSNKNASAPPQAPKFSEIKLINYDFAKYGSSAERNRLLTKWDKEVSTLPK